VQAKSTITYPTVSTTWVTGKIATITWVNDGAITENTTPLVLLNGPENKLKQVFTIADSVDVRKLIYNFTVPNTIDSGSDYTVRIGVKEPNYSARFTITNSGSSNSTTTTKPTNKPTATST
ncbi:7833_t:CDS:2, partial [Paraglomus occultum]